MKTRSVEGHLFRHIIVFLLVLTIASGFWGNASLFGVHPAYAEGKVKAKAKKTEKAADSKEKHPDFEYINLKPLVLPVITDRGLTQQVSLFVSLELPYGKMDDVEPFEPRLADAYLQDLYGALGAGGAMMTGGNLVDVQAIKQRLTSVTHKVLGTENVHDVLLQVVQQRPSSH